MSDRGDVRLTADERDALERALAGWCSTLPSYAVVDRLPGLSNRSYRVVLDPRDPYPGGADVVVRLPGPHRDVPVDREIEARAARRAAAAGVAPAVRHADPARGVLIVDFVSGGRPLTAEDLARAEVAGAVVAALDAFHATPALGRVLDPHTALADYRMRLAGGAHAGADARAVLDRAQRVADALPSGGRPVPSHGDPTPGNVLLDGDAVRLVDFEYAGDADPLWDLAELAASHALDPRATRHLVDASGVDEGALARWRVVCDAVAAAWGLMTGTDTLARARLDACARGLAAFGIRDSRGT